MLGDAGARHVLPQGAGPSQGLMPDRSTERAVGMAEKRPIAAFEKNSRPVRRRSCIDFDIEDFSGLRGSDERDRTTAEWDWLPDAAAGSTSLWNWESERVP